MRAAMAVHILLLLVAVSVQGCSNPLEKQPVRITIDIAADGSLFLDGNAVDGDELKESLQAKFQTSPKEKIMTMDVSLLEVMIKTELDARHQSVARVLDSCSRTAIRRIWFSNPAVNGGREVKLWLPCGETPEPFDSTLKRAMYKTPRGEAAADADAQPVPEETPTEHPEGREADSEKQAAVYPFRVSVKLFWVNKGTYRTGLPVCQDPEGCLGITAVVDKTSYSIRRELPDWIQLEEVLKQSLSDYSRAGKKRPLPVRIDPELNVPFADVLRCVVVCQKLGFEHIFLAAPQ
jgi:biopolymer transport protein ExbD